jgi:predicted HTH transcriptional regulator
MKKRNLLLILFVLAVPLVILYFLAEMEEKLEEAGDGSQESEDKKPKAEDSKTENGFAQNKTSKKSKDLSRQETEGRSLSPQNTNHGSRITKTQKSGDQNQLTDRQSEIFEFISRNKEAKMLDLTKSFKNVTERTLRRDLARLQELNLIGKKGSTKSSVYFLY